jgi:signal transduction histidine kinase/ligand-binding sensor domain-containing protein
MLAAYVAIACGCIPAFALESDRSISQFVHRAWTTKDGAPGGIQALGQTRDGYLWLGTNNGLYRFDGVSFERYEPVKGSPFSSANVYSLLPLQNGDLWIGYQEGGVSLLHNGTNTNFTQAEGLPPGPVWSLAQDREGAIWAAAGPAIAKFQGGRWESRADWKFPGSRSGGIYFDRHGTLWATNKDSIVFLPRGATKFEPTGIPVRQVWQFAESASGRLWMAETTRSVRPVPLPGHGQAAGGAEIKVGSLAILFARDGSLWITSLGDGVRRLPFPDRPDGGTIDAVESITSKEGLSADQAWAILEDKEGNIWVGTVNGLDRFRKGPLLPIELPGRYGLLGLVAGSDGDVWVGGLASRLARIHGRAWKLDGPNVSMSSVYHSGGLVLWYDHTFNTIVRYEKGRFTRIRLPVTLLNRSPGPIMFEDRSGILWFASQGVGLFFRKGGQWTRSELPAEFSKLSLAAAFTDPMGRVWFGCTDNAVVRIDGTDIRTFDTKDGLAVGTVRAIGGSHHIWAAGEHGLALFDGNGFRTVAPADGASFGSVSGVVETPDGSLWLSEYRGAIHLPAAELSRFTQNASYRVQYQLFDFRDGLPGAIQQSLPFPTVIQGSDGRLWFATTNGVASIDPSHISRNQLPPPVSIRSVTAAGKRYTLLDDLKLPALTRSLQIDYTALSLSVPERVQFRYLLEGSDKVWQEPGTRRQAFYTNLGPGTYNFRVVACNNDGVWNESGASLGFTIAPAFYQAVWFQLLCLASGAGILYFFYRLRVQQATVHVQGRLQERLAERERIARELHDTLLQGFQGLTLHFQAAMKQIPDREPARLTMEKALKLADEVLLEGRKRVRDLRSEGAISSELPEMLASLGQELTQDLAVTFKVTVIGSPQSLHPVACGEIYRIAREALTNAFGHSHAGNIEVEAVYDFTSFSLRVRDNGCGIDHDVLIRGREGHWGLSGMRERAQNIGGQLKVWSNPGAGTELDFRMPAKLAYVRKHKESRWSWRTLATKGGKGTE